MKATAILALTIALATPAGRPRAQQATASAVALTPTNHPHVPRELSQLWLVPAGAPNRAAGFEEFTSAVKLEVEGRFAEALPLLSKSSLREGPLGQYAEYYRGLAELRLGRADQARQVFQLLRAGGLVGYLAEAALLREAESDEALGEYRAAIDLYEGMSSPKTIGLDEWLMRVGRAAKGAGDGEKATRMFEHVYYEFPLSGHAISAGAEVDHGPIAGSDERMARQLDRAERLYKARRYDMARREFESRRKVAVGDDRDLVNLRIAECDFFLKRPRASRDELRPYLDRAPRQSEALYFYAVAVRDLGAEAEFRKTVDRLTTDFGTEAWAEEALDGLATYEIRRNDDQKADEAFRELYGRFPTGRYAERAAWKIGWWAYKTGRFVDTVHFFEKAAADFPRSDYRPAWLYWSGRAHEALTQDAQAQACYSLAADDYLNSYYGRLATGRLMERGLRPPGRRLVIDPRSSNDGPVTATNGHRGVATHPPNETLVRALLDLGLFEQAIDELHYAQKAWGDAPAIEATLAWTFLQQARTEAGTEQFTLLRSAISAMKRAYPQYLAAGGEELPSDILKVIFPIGYWDLIQKYSGEYKIDPFLAAALIAQESTFVRDIKSYANAVGLTQLMPRTARQYARTLKLRYTSALLTNPEANIRMGMAYLADKVTEFGEIHLALASYNAGERPVHRWSMERPGVAQDEFIDDIPFPQTQNYVKKILGTAEDYRRLYSDSTPRIALAGADRTISANPDRTPTKVASPARRKKTRKTA